MLWYIANKIIESYVNARMQERLSKRPRRTKLTKKECIELKNAIAWRVMNEDYTCRLPKEQKIERKKYPRHKEDFSRYSHQPKPRIRYRLKLCCDRIRVRDHTKPNGYRCYNHYYYQ